MQIYEKNKKVKNKKQRDCRYLLYRHEFEAKIVSNGFHAVLLFLFFIFFIFLFLSNFGICGYIGNSISTFFFGAVGTTHYIIPAVSFILAILLISNDYSSLAVKKTCFAILLLCMVSTIFQMIYNIEVRDSLKEEKQGE